MNNQTIVQRNPAKLAKWQQALLEVVRTPQALWQLLDLDPELLPGALQAAKTFDLRVPRQFIAKMEKANINDPLLKQVLPLGEELSDVREFSLDPLQEKSVNQIPGLLHKYHGRVLLTVVSACGVNCRYCFRRHFNYAENNVGQMGREKIIQYIKNDPSISEVIYSGGDPLLATDDFLKKLTEQITDISHVKRIRIHTRLPVVIPERITDEFIAWFANPRFQSVLVLHCNHPKEIDDQLKNAVDQLKKNNITVLNQSVLLKGVNDDAETLAHLSEVLFAAGIMPYYLHLLDKVKGAAHFDILDDESRKIYGELQGLLPGFLVPRLVREVPEVAHKVLSHFAT